MPRPLEIALVVFLMLVPAWRLYLLWRSGKLAESGALRWQAWVRSIALWALFGAIGIEILWPEVPMEQLFYVELTALIVFGMSFLFLLFRKKDAPGWPT